MPKSHPDGEPTRGLFDRDRPFAGQPHTDQGDRGRFRLIPADPLQAIPRGDRDLDLQHITLRDIADAMIIGILKAKKRPDKDYTASQYGLVFDDPNMQFSLPVEQIRTPEQLQEELDKDPGFDPLAAVQAACVELEKRLGIYPNIRELPNITPRTPTLAVYPYSDDIPKPYG